MNRNAWILILLLSFSVFLTKCAAFRPIGDNSQISTPSSTTKASSSTKFRSDIVDFAKNYKGSKYQYGGTTPQGFDCSGFVVYVLNNFDIQVPRSSATQATYGKKIPIQKAKAGDLLFFRRKGKINHVGLVVQQDDSGLYMIHSSSRGVVIDNVYENTYWKPLLDSARNVLD